MLVSNRVNRYLSYPFSLHWFFPFLLTLQQPHTVSLYLECSSGLVLGKLTVNLTKIVIKRYFNLEEERRKIKRLKNKKEKKEIKRRNAI